MLSGPLSGSEDLPADAYTLRGDILVELGRIAEAAGSYFTATVSASGNLYARMHLGSCLRRLGRWQEAVEAATRQMIAELRDETLAGKLATA